MPKAGPNARCAYCGTLVAPELDHVPPKNLFAKPRPSNLITVTACLACHRPTSPDDEYFRLALAARREAANHPDVIGGVLDASLRSLSRVSAQGLTTRFMRTVRVFEARSPAGLYLGEVGTYEPDAKRLMAVVERTVRGLYFHRLRRPLGVDVVVTSMEDTLTDFDRIPTDKQQALTQLVKMLAASEWKHIGNAFSYACWIAPENPSASVWLTRFFGTTVFLSLTAPNEPAKRQNRPPGHRG